ncbi:MAG: 50S ribosomal protein L10, large subunit ribosomal protein L10 [Candidatus Gottesmanbacteria bacterium GW2011_GWA2_43_14]|uniref:Large ribosomal subunit protein uL10 n=1 Tax=Candidatus Gottesmanbacteria bacterium GW2011_GWA2_43_14 TaxID=1618443 RepID=A0A0G1GF98_9BACT|nr:MAG: 50S ribosomal protein L10, large subunit ribosomal protein L10 [Candidatus Gottesmanbacteria bacterium GW2011_GWA2_43_14]
MKTKPNQKKQDTVKDLSDKFARAKAFFLTDYKGLTHKELEDLRRKLKKVEADYVVVKNTLLKKGMEEKDKTLEPLYEHLKQSTAMLFAFGDEIEAVKILADFAKNATMPKVKAGFFSGSIASEADFKKLASLPSRNILLTTLLNRLNSPIQGFHYALSWNLQQFVTVLENVKNKKAN